jgi:predicted enzyme related to lactoylglutathione lyase
MNTVAYFEIQSSNPARAAEFYRAVFGWIIIKDDSQPIDYWRIATGGIEGAILERPAAATSASGANAFCCSIRVESFDVTAEKILSRGGVVALPKMAVPGRCWQGYFLDTDGNVFGIFEVDESAE